MGFSILQWRRNKGLIPKVGGRYRENMTFDEETELLKQFEEKAKKGQLVETSEIKEAYEKSYRT